MLGGGTSCSNDNEPDSPRELKAYRLEISKNETLAILSDNASRAYDETSVGLFKVDPDGNISAVETIVHYDDEGGSSTETLKMRMNAIDMFSVTEDLMIFFGCTFIDQNDNVPYSENVILVNKSSGIIYSLGTSSYLFEAGFGVPRDNLYAQKSPTSFLVSCSTSGNWLYSVEIIGQEAVLKEMVSPSAPVFSPWQSYLLALSGDKIGLGYNSQGNSGMASIVYPNGGYEKFDNGNFVILDSSILSFTQNDSDFDFSYQSEWIHLGAEYGQSSRENLDFPVDFADNGSFYITSWFETGQNVVIAYHNSPDSKQQKFMAFDKAAKKFNGLSIQFSGQSDLELWKDNLVDNSFYGLVRNNAGEISAICHLDPYTFDYGETTLDLGDIDITSIEPCYSQGSLQLIGTRRSDGYKVAVDIDLRKGSYTTLFSNPNLTVRTLLRLN